MTRYTATSKMGERLRLFSDDTFTFALCATRSEPTSQETTAEELAEIFPVTQLAKLHQADPCRKTARAILLSIQDYLD